NNKNKPLFEKWVHGMDIKNANLMIRAIESPKKHEEKKENKKNNSNVNTFDALKNLNEFGEYYESEEDYESEDLSDSPENDDDEVDPFDPMQRTFLLNWEESKTNSPLEMLKNDPDVWKMSKSERITLHDFWRQNLNDEHVKELARLQTSHDEARKEVDNIYNESRKKI